MIKSKAPRSFINSAGTRASPNTSATVTPASAPAIICPSPPMLIMPPRKAIVMPMPTNNIGVALTKVSAVAFSLPTAPLEHGRISRQRVRVQRHQKHRRHQQRQQ